MSKNEKILIVDDEILNVTVLGDLLKDDYTVMVAKNGKQALKVVEMQNPDLVLLDIMMPEMDGYEVCKRLKDNPVTKDIPVIFISAMGQEEDETKGLELGAVDYIRKPISPAITKSRVKTHIELRNTYKELESQKNRMQQELDVGHRMQLGMLPTVFPDHDNFSIYASLRPAKEMSGDFYDFFLIDDNHVVFCVGDVSGKGVPAALFMAQTKILLKSHITSADSMAESVYRVNFMLSQDNDAGMFVTLFLACINLKTGELQYVNCGHQPPLILRSNGELERMQNPQDIILGVMEDYQYTSLRSDLNTEDAILIYTDGITEAIDSNKNMYGEERLMNLLKSSNGVTPQQMVKNIIDDVDSFADEIDQFDDITVLSLKRR